MIRACYIVISVLSVSCWATLSPAASEPFGPSAAQRRLEAHVRTWATDRGVNARNVAYHYAGRATYYGKRMSRREILRDKLRYIAVWPARRYSILPGTVSAKCDRQLNACRLSGIMQWHRRSRSGEVSIGKARLTLVLAEAGGSRIVRESAVILTARPSHP